jgi:hypothetical protein
LPTVAIVGELVARCFLAVGEKRLDSNGAPKLKQNHKTQAKPQNSSKTTKLKQTHKTQANTPNS